MVTGSDTFCLIWHAVLGSILLVGFLTLRKPDQIVISPLEVSPVYGTQALTMLLVKIPYTDIDYRELHLDLYLCCRLSTTRELVL